MCHESSGSALGQTIGIGKGTVTLDDFGQADVIIIAGQNPGTNHPRMLTALEQAKRDGATIMAINPLPEAGLLRFKNPQRVRGMVGRGTQLADHFAQIRLNGDLALFQAMGSWCWRPSGPDARPSITTSSNAHRGLRGVLGDAGRPGWGHVEATGLHP